MKNTFVLDECVLVCAQTGEDDHGVADLSAAKLIVDVIQNCHRIAENADILAKYDNQFSALAASHRFMSALNVVSVLRNMIFNQDKSIEIQHATPLESEMVAVIPNDDLPFVSAAVTASAILVTVDGRLRERLNDCGATTRYSLRVLRPEEATPFAAPADP